MTDKSSEDTTEPYQVLLAILEEYFPTSNDPEDRSPQLVEKYRNLGESTIKFKGLMSELEEAIRKPNESSRAINATLGSSFGPGEIRKMLISLHDQLQGTDPEAEEAHGDPEKTLSYYTSRSWRLPLPKLAADAEGKKKFVVSDVNIPIWGVVLGGLVIGGIGWALVNYTTARSVGVALCFVASIIMLMGIYTMIALRDQVVNRTKYVEKERKLQEWNEERAAKAGRKKKRLRTL